MKKYPVPAPHEQRQAELIRRFCTDAEAAISTAASYGAAVRMRDELCSRFARECDSPLVVNATRSYLDAVLQDTWSHDTGEQHIPRNDH